MSIFPFEGESGDWMDSVEPTDDELVAIEAEWADIEADLAAVDAELAAVRVYRSCRVPARRVRRRRLRRFLAGGGSR